MVTVPIPDAQKNIIAQLLDKYTLLCWGDIFDRLEFLDHTLINH